MLRDHGQEVLRLRRRLKHRRPRQVPRNLLWALDLTTLPGPGGSRTVLGVLDHGSRACLVLRELRSRSAITLLRALLDARDLALFCVWYNHARPHQHLDGLTPALAWAGRRPPTGRPGYVSE